MTIASRVAAMAAQPADPASAPIRAVFAAEQAGLAAAGTPPGVAPAGSRLSDVALLDPLGVPTTLSGALAGQLGVVVLYRGGWCPYCNLALKTYESELLPRLGEQNAVLVAVSPQPRKGRCRSSKSTIFTIPSVRSRQPDRFSAGRGDRSFPRSP